MKILVGVFAVHMRKHRRHVARAGDGAWRHRLLDARKVIGR